jgi:hypothetical protein
VWAPPSSGGKGQHAGGRACQAAKCRAVLPRMSPRQASAPAASSAAAAAACPAWAASISAVRPSGGGAHAALRAARFRPGHLAGASGAARTPATVRPPERRRLLQRAQHPRASPGPPPAGGPAAPRRSRSARPAFPTLQTPPSRVWASLSMLRPIGIAIWEGIAAAVAAATWLTARCAALSPALTCARGERGRGRGIGIGRGRGPRGGGAPSGEGAGGPLRPPRPAAGPRVGRRRRPATSPGTALCPAFPGAPGPPTRPPPPSRPPGGRRSAPRGATGSGRPSSARGSAPGWPAREGRRARGG